MRIVIAGSQKSGNVWLKCLLANTYDLEVIDVKDGPARPRLETFQEWVAAGKFRDGTIIHHHFRYSPEMAGAIEGVPAKIVTIVRDPYDSFVSYYFAVQTRRGRGLRRDPVVGKPIDHPDVLAYLEKGGDAGQMRLALGWMESGRTTVVRYEDLHRNVPTALSGLAGSLGAAPDEKRHGAAEACRADTMQRLDDVKAGHVRAATVGDSRQRLTDPHLAIFRGVYGDLIRSLGYEVR
jgi:hypothetical protein